MASDPANLMVARRAAGQQLAGRRFATPAELVAWMGAMQAQDYHGSLWAAGLRLADPAVRDATIERALADGSILRTHALRGTWQLIAAADLRWLLALVGPVVLRSFATRHRQLGLDAATLRRGDAALASALGQGEQLTRRELACALERAGVDVGGQRLAHLLGRAELTGLLCSGGRRGKQSTWALLDLRVPGRAAIRDRAAALAELARRYFRSRGPATVRDFIWWSGLPAADARAGVEAIAPELISEVIDGRTFWRGQGGPASGAPAGACLLPPFDEYLVGYRDRDAVLDPRFVGRLNAGGGMLGAAILHRGRVIGTWSRVRSPAGVTVQLETFRRPTRPVRAAITAAARRYGTFLGVAPRAVVVDTA